jgi:septal ring factor EnvC (AmiA/AmiB activator)
MARASIEIRPEAAYVGAMSRRLYSLALAGIVLLALCAAGGDAQVRQKALSAQDQATLDNLSAQLRANDRRVEASRQSARQIALEVEDLRNQIIDISKKQGMSEKRVAIYQARLETLNLQEADIERKLVAMRGKESRLLSALEIYSRNPPPAIFVPSRKVNDAVLAAIIMRAITPELQKQTKILAQRNADLVNLRRQTALQNDALFVSEGDVADQREQIEKLITQKGELEDQLLDQADKIAAQSVELKARQARMYGRGPLGGLLGPPQDNNHLQPPVVGDKTHDFGQDDARGVSYAADPGSQVTAPAEGEVEFAGPIDSYGQVVILNVGHNMRVVLTGMERIYVDKGQTVGRHEPLGRMPNLSDRKTTLYMELRRGDQPVNPGMAIS